MDSLASNSISLYLFEITGCSTAPLPLPPLIVAETTVEISKSCGSTRTDSTDPLTTGLTKALVPVVGESTSTYGGLRTSYPDPKFTTLMLSNGP